MRRLAHRIRKWLDYYAPDPKTEAYKDLAAAWEKSAKDTLSTLQSSTESFGKELEKIKLHYRILERSYGSYIANNAGIKIKLKMDEEWPERYSLQVLVPPQLGLYLMDPKWDAQQKEIHIKNFSAMLAAAVEQESYVFLKERLKRQTPVKNERTSPKS